MDYMTRYDETERIELADGYWVEVRKCLTGKAKRQIRNKQITYGVERDGAGPTRAVVTNIDPDVYLYELAVASIVDWNLPAGDDGPGKWPLNPDSARRAHYDKLTEEDQDTIEAACSRLNAEPTREDDAQFPAEREGSVPAEEDDASDDREVLDGAETVGASGVTS